MKNRSSFRHLRPLVSRNVRQLLLPLAACLLPACTMLQTGPASPEQRVQQRAEARWKAHIAGEWETAYSLAAPSYRALNDLDRYRGTMGGAVAWKKVDVVSVECAEDLTVCTARIRMEFQAPLRSRKGEIESTYFNEKWVAEEGQWYFLPRR